MDEAVYRGGLDPRSLAVLEDEEGLWVDEGVEAADATILGTRLIVAETEVPCLILVPDSCSSTEMASEQVGKRMESAGVVAEYPKDPVQVVHSVIPSIVHPTKGQLDGVQACEWECGPVPVLGAYSPNERASYPHQLGSPPTL